MQFIPTPWYQWPPILINFKYRSFVIYNSPFEWIDRQVQRTIVFTLLKPILALLADGPNIMLSEQESKYTLHDRILLIQCKIRPATLVFKFNVTSLIPIQLLCHKFSRLNLSLCQSIRRSQPYIYYVCILYTKNI